MDVQVEISVNLQDKRILKSSRSTQRARKPMIRTATRGRA